MFKRNTATGPWDRVASSEATALTCKEPSRTRQDQKDQADINTIVRAFGVTGKLPVIPNLPEYGDFTEAPRDYRDALERIQAAEEAFMSIPAKTRALFNNSAVDFFDAVHTATPDQLKEWGLTNPEAPTQVPLP